jgi:outer membrane protein OmpA-like peptidoglycan-associated protein
MTTVLKTTFPVLALATLISAAALAQSSQAPPASHVIGRSIKAIGYQVGGGGTTVDLASTGLISGATGEAKVEAKASVTTVEAKVRGLEIPTPLGTEFLAYVLWAVSLEGRAVNLGEVRPDDDGEGELKVTTQLQSFSLFVTAEPYSSVRLPSEMVVLENDVRKNTKGRLFVVDDYKLMKRSQYRKRDNPLDLSLDLKNVPLEMYQARNAVEIARSRGADHYAREIFSKAEGGLELAENALARKADKREIISLARQTIQSSEDARTLTAERQEQERIVAERAAAAATAKAEAEAKAAAEAAAEKERAATEAQRHAELAAAREAQLKADAAARLAEAEQREALLKAAAAARESQLKLEAAAKEAAGREARIAVELEAAGREASAKAEAERARGAAEALRAQLLEQFNRILETRDSVRGLVITMADVLFDTGRYDLRPPTREALARLSGIVLAHPGLKLEVEGHTDSTGSDEFNQALSEQRANTVRGYLIQQGLSADAVTARGFGKTAPVADNSTAAGRQKNRRVELVVSGEVIGVQISE